MRRRRTEGAGRPAAAHAAARGVVLIVCLVVLTVLSLTAAVSVRGASSSDAVAAHARAQAIALQAAEAALLHCERGALVHAGDPDSGIAPAAAPVTPDGSPLWQDPEQWDGDQRAAVVTLPWDTADATGRHTVVQRAPECLVEGYDATRPGSLVITARGWGPEPQAPGPAGESAGGTEVWLQAVVFVQPDAAGLPVVTARWWRQLFLRSL